MARTEFIVNTSNPSRLTPGKHPLTVPSKALADAIEAEWKGAKKFNPDKMPLTALAYTAIDRIEGQEPNIIEALMVYIDTDTLSYRASGSEKLADLQKKYWDPILDWANKTLGATWKTTDGVMPLEQPKKLHQVVEKRLKKMNSMQLASFCLFASGFSSLVLALAVFDKHLAVDDAFRLSRLEEDTQAQAWGLDADAETRAKRLHAEIVDAGRFLSLLEAEK
jgi:chaperone required for assembly of F1-ATPase